MSRAVFERVRQHRRARWVSCRSVAIVREKELDVVFYPWLHGLLGALPFIVFFRSDRWFLVLVVFCWTILSPGVTLWSVAGEKSAALPDPYRGPGLDLDPVEEDRDQRPGWAVSLGMFGALVAIMVLFPDHDFTHQSMIFAGLCNFIAPWQRNRFISQETVLARPGKRWLLTWRTPEVFRIKPPTFY